MTTKEAIKAIEDYFRTSLAIDGACEKRAKEALEWLKEQQKTESRCLVGGVDRSGAVDRISIRNAVETPFWMAIYATEPERDVEVRMTYEDLNMICELIDEKRKDLKSKDGGQPR